VPVKTKLLYVFVFTGETPGGGEIYRRVAAQNLHDAMDLFAVSWPTWIIRSVKTESHAVLVEVEGQD
jgi:hypothetical protein